MKRKERKQRQLDFSDKGFVIRMGRVFFKSRNFVSAPFFLIMLTVFWQEYENDILIWTIGPILVLAGEALRLWAMSHIGRSARTRKDKARRLVVSGPYAYSRNPLYVGNHLILIGFCLLSELLWLLPVALAACFAFYQCIVRYEEELLRQKFDKDYHDYTSRVPRWLPSPSPEKIVGPRWAEALFRERSTIYGLILGIGVFACKEFLSHYLH